MDTARRGLKEQGALRRASFVHPGEEEERFDGLYPSLASHLQIPEAMFNLNSSYVQQPLPPLRRSKAPPAKRGGGRVRAAINNRRVLCPLSCPVIYI